MHAAGAGCVRHSPARQVSATVQGSASGHGVPSASRVQLPAQQSPLVLLPSSHSSPRSSVPLPHTEPTSSSHSSLPVRLSAATKKSLPPAAVSSAGDDEDAPGFRSATRAVPPGVPSLRQSSTPATASNVLK